MKTSFTLIFSILIIQLMAQPTIMSSWAPNEGDKVIDIVGANAINLDAGQSGANSTWDYSAVVQDPNVPVAGFEYASPSVSSFAGLFPDATICVVVSDVDPSTLPTTFYKESSAQFELLGNALPMVSFIYSDPQVLMKFPFSFGDSFQDDFAAVVDINGITSDQTGQVTVTYDSYGAITTPKGTFNNVVRVKTVTNRKDSTAIAPGSYSLVNENIVSYVWFDGTVGRNVASLSITNGETMTVTAGMVFTDVLPETRAFSWNDASGTSSLEEINGTLPFTINTYGPNPVVDEFKINLSSEINGELNIELINNAGQLINQQKSALFSGNNEINIQMEDVPAGNYFVKLIHGEDYGVFQIIKK